MKNQHKDNLENLKGTLPLAVGKCPHLGLKNDPDTSFDYPSIWNTCHRSNPPEVPLLDHQAVTCLTPEHTNCPIFLSTGNDKLPSSLIEHGRGKNIKRSKRRWIFGLIIILLSFIVLFVLSQFLKPGQTPEQTQVNTPQATTPSFMEQETQLVAVTTDIIESPTQEVTPPEVNISTDTPAVEEVLHKLDTPIGTDQKFILHKIADGESLEQYAVLYNTSRETIVKINYLLPIPLWIDRLVVIPLDLIDAVDLPTFEAYLVTDEEISLEKLALKLGSDVEKMAYFNGIKSSHVFYRGDYILVPREGYYFTNP